MRWQVVVATGCFDILHIGHVRLLEFAKRQGQFLLVGINSDGSVRALKGEGRPINNQESRAEMLSALACVDAVCVFDDIRATKFLRLAHPSVWVKGGDYTLETLDQDERNAVESRDGVIRFFKPVEGVSSTAIVEKCRHNSSPNG